MSNGTITVRGEEIGYEQAKSMLVPELIAQEGNEARLADVPSRQMEDMAVIYRLDLGEMNGGHASIVVNNDLMEHFGVTAEQLHEDMQANAPLTHPVSIRSMEEVLGEMMGGMPLPGPEPGQPYLFVASRQDMFQGAGIMAYPDFFQQAAEKVGGDFFIQPSSIHEILLLPDDGSMGWQELTNMVQSVNASEVLPEERLSDNVFHFDAQDKVFERADKFEQRQQKREKEMEKSEGRHSVLKVLGQKKEECKEQPAKPGRGAKTAEAVI